MHQNVGRSEALLTRRERYAIPVLVVAVLAIILGFGYLLQSSVERSSLPPVDTSTPKEEYEIAKLAAEIRRIGSDTYGSLFWLKAVALLVTVGGAVGGYLIGQSRTTQRRLQQERAIEDRRNVDAQYQALVQELSDSNSALLRAAATVKLGQILSSFPSEWGVSQDRRKQLIELTKRVLAAALAIETNEKVRKTLTSALALHKPWEKDSKKGYADLRGIDLSTVKADDAYWAKVDFSYADFYAAEVNEASFKRAILCDAQFRETKLRNAVLIEANCEKANFKLADLRGANLSEAKLIETNFEGAQVHGTILTEAETRDIPETQVDVSAAADGSEMLPVREWLSQHGLTQPGRAS
jgi:hypothetical protein